MSMPLLLGASSFRGALDGLETGLESAWSVGRRLLTPYNGPIIRVRRSADNAEQDFPAGADGAVSPSAVAAFCGAGDGFLTTIYGQSGLSRNLVQTITTTQPTVVLGGVPCTKNGRLAAELYGSTSNRHVRVLSSEAIYKFLHDGTTWTFYGVQECVADFNAKFLFGTFNVGTDVGARFWSTSAEVLQARVQGTSPEVPIDVTKTGLLGFNTLSGLIDADNATAADRESLWLDGSLMATDNAQTGIVSSANSTRIFTYGANSSNGSSWNGKLCELVIWSGDRTANRAIWEASAKAFWGTP